MELEPNGIKLNLKWTLKSNCHGTYELNEKLNASMHRKSVLYSDTLRVFHSGLLSDFVFNFNNKKCGHYPGSCSNILYGINIEYIIYNTSIINNNNMD